MEYKYTHFIPQNTAPKGTKSIGVYDGSGKRITTISLGNLSPIKKEKLYSFGLVSDIHITHNPNVNWYAASKFDNALTYFENKGCVACVVCGDFTNEGFYPSIDGTVTLNETEFSNYKEICNKHSIPVYELCGNHESYNGKAISNSLDLLETYTGKKAISYTVSSMETTEDGRNHQLLDIGNDLFILMGQSESSKPMSNADLDWLVNVLENNKDKRCFVFMHSFIDENWNTNILGDKEAEDTDGFIISDSGNACDVRPNAIVGWWEDYDQPTLNKFLTALSSNKNVVLFHGHSHMKLENQEFDKSANYTNKNGFKSVHVPSLSYPRDIDFVNDKSVDDRTASEGYIVDVYDDCIVLNGRNFINDKWCPLGVYKIDTVQGIS